MEHHVVAFAKGQAQFVSPGTLNVHAGDTVVFESPGQDRVFVFPPGTPLGFKPVEGEWGMIPVPAGTSSDPLSVPSRGASYRGRYPYAVWCDNANHALKAFAKGNSDPEIILY